ncbi:MAG: hypothetical protein J6C44_07915 [Muribaculaceae bacterium]|nr:hypothetical protein [Muribaculaceae bacterium]
MKRLFTLLLMALSLTAISANVTLTARHSNSRLVNPRAKSQEKVIQRSSATWSVPTGEWTKLGTGRLTDDMVTAWYQYPALTFDVEIEQSVENPNYYRVIAPYGLKFKEAFEAANKVTLKDGQWDADNKAVWVFDVTDPKAVYFPKTMLGIDWGEGEMYLGIPSTADPVWNNGVMTAPPRGIAIGDNTGAVAVNMRGQFRLTIPGTTELDYRLSLTTDDECLSNRKTQGQLFVGSDIATVKCGIFNDGFEDEMISMYKTTVSNGSTVTFSGNVSIEMEPEVNKLIIVFVGLDASGSQVAQTWKTFYYVDSADNADWQDEGIAKFTNSLTSTFYNTPVETYECRLQRHKYRPGYLRLVNPFEKSPYNQDRYMHRGHDHFIYIVADDPELIYLDQSPLGLDFGHGQCRVWSDVGYYLAAGFDPDECKELEMGIKVDGQTWVCPDEHAQFSALDYDNADWYYAPTGTTIEMPENFSLGVKDIIANDDNTNAPVEYFSIDGRRINPAETRGLVIRRQGSNVTKQVIR